MVNEEKLRKALAKILEKPAYRGLYTFEREHLINDIVQAVKESEPKPKALLESEEEEEEEEEY